MSRIAAAQAAIDALNELGLDQASPVDPFGALEDAGLMLSFKPLKDLLGVILPGNPGGVLINSARPASLQRYTAAHELGHWYLHKDVLRLDTDEAIEGHHHDVRELDAQTFAAHFLMPLELLYLTARRYGIRRVPDARPEEVYQAARDMHVSYEAAVRQFANTKMISATNRSQLLKVRPAVIKRQLADGLTLPDARGDVWVFDSPGEHVAVEAFVGDAIVLRLTERPSTGYRWCAETALTAKIHEFRQPPRSFVGGRAFEHEAPSQVAEVIPLPATCVRSEVVTLLRDEVLREPYGSNATLVGGPVTRLVAYGAGAPGRESIHLSEVRPFRPDVCVSKLEVTTRVRGAPEAEFRQRLIEDFMRHEANAGDSDD